jgi:hypothetical protein
MSADAAINERWGEAARTRWRLPGARRSPPHNVLSTDFASVFGGAAGFDAFQTLGKDARMEVVAPPLVKAGPLSRVS